MQESLEQKWVQGIDYLTFRKLVDDLLAQNKTTGDNHAEAMIHYTKMNVQRMKRLDKTTKITPQLQEVVQKLTQKYHWLILVEAWCGDVATNLPIIDKIAALSPQIELRLLLRDQHLDLMNLHKTNGGLAIPKLICFNEAGEVLSSWGPRPKPAQEMVMAHKANPQESYQDFVVKVQQWYNQDKTTTLQTEFLDLISKHKTINSSF